MRKKLLLYILFILMISVMSACCRNHQWAEATCTAPRTCVKCNETEGEALGHKWIAATCTEKEHCEICNETKGEPLGHVFLKPTLSTPAKCQTCGLEEGNALSFAKRDMSYVSEYDRVYLYGDKALGVKKNKRSFVLDYHTEGKDEVVSVEVPMGRHSWSYSVFMNDDISAATVIGTSDSVSVLTLYDWEGREVGNCNVNFEGKVPPYVECVAEGEVLYLVEPEEKKVIVAYNLPELSETDIKELPAKEEPEFVKDYEYCEYCKAVEAYLVYDEVSASMIFMDKSGEKIKTYGDATVFSQNGYAFVSEDKISYSLIDKDFEVLDEDYISADAIALIPETNTFMVLTGETVEYYSISESE